MADILIYDWIGSLGVNAQQIALRLEELAERERIVVGINSLGGRIDEGLAIYNLLANHPKPITVEIHGVAASMASAIAMAGNPVRIPENGLMMLHNPWDSESGEAQDFRKKADLLEKVGDSLASIYVRKTGLSKEEITEMMAAETWLDSQEAIRLKFADELIEPVGAEALPVRSLKDYSNVKAVASILGLPSTAGGSKRGSRQDVMARLELEYQRGKREAREAAAQEIEAAARRERERILALEAAAQGLPPSAALEAALREMKADGEMTAEKAAARLLEISKDHLRMLAALREENPPALGSPPPSSPAEDAARAGDGGGHARDLVEELSRRGLLQRRR